MVDEKRSAEFLKNEADRAEVRAKEAKELAKARPVPSFTKKEFAARAARKKAAREG